MTKQQMKEIFSTISTGDSKLKILVISGKIPLASVEPGLLARAANRLEGLHMYSTRLTTKQGEAMLEQSLVKTSLRTLDMGPVIRRIRGGAGGKSQTSHQKNLLPS